MMTQVTTLVSQVYWVRVHFRLLGYNDPRELNQSHSLFGIHYLQVACHLVAGVDGALWQNRLETPFQNTT